MKCVTIKTRIFGQALMSFYVVSDNGIRPGANSQPSEK